MTMVTGGQQGHLQENTHTAQAGKIRKIRMEKKITIAAYAKINLSLDVLGRRPDGYHEIDTVMQAAGLHDDVTVSWSPSPGRRNVTLTVRSEGLDEEREDVPADERNLAYKAAEKMFAAFPEMEGDIAIDLLKRIPSAAGMAGGSADCAAVLLAADALWGKNSALGDLMDTGGGLGSDVPFQIMVQARLEKKLGRSDDPMASAAARARGTGAVLEPAAPLESYVVLSTPPVRVSTKEVYEGIDSVQTEEHPDNDSLVKALAEGDRARAAENMINVLEKYTLQVYSKVYENKYLMESHAREKDIVLMSGSGPTVFALTETEEGAAGLFRIANGAGASAFLTKTLTG